MNKLFALTKRNLLESIREPLTLVFCIAFPVVMLVFMQIIFNSVAFSPINFEIKNYAIGICIFGYAFTGMFTAMNIAGDKNTSFIKRINVSPTNKIVYYLSFVLSGLPIAFIQTVLFFVIAFIFKFPFDYRVLFSILYLFPSALTYVSFGALIGVICSNEKQTGPICSILVSLVGVLGGVFMPTEMFTGGFATFVNLLPFIHSTKIASEIYSVGINCFFNHVLYLICYVLICWLVIYLIEKIRKK